MIKNSTRQVVNIGQISKAQMDISIVMPAHNEAKNIERGVTRILHALQGSGLTYEMIVVDDGSDDGTQTVLEKLSSTSPSIVYLRKARNGGKGTTVRYAAEHVRGASVIIIDADMEVDPEDLRQYAQLLNDYDICIASKRHPQSVYHAPVMRKLLSIAFNKLVRVMTGVKFADSQTGLKAIRGEHFRKIMKLLSVKRYAYDVEILAVAGLMHLRVAELPVKIVQTAGFSKKAIMFMLLDLLGITYRLRLIKWYQKNLDGLEPKYKPVLRI